MKRINWQVWAGFVFSLAAGFSYPFVFVRWPITREFPWANLILFAIAFVFLFLGLRRAFKPDKRIVSKIFSSLAAAFGVFLLAALLFVIFVMGSWLPPSSAAPQIGQKAPDFTLIDANDKPVTLAQLLTEPINNKRTKGVLLIFYREYIRLKLLKYFQWCGSDVPDIDADETINRVTRRIYEGQDVYNLTGYIYGVARLVHAESLKRRNRRRALDERSFIELSSISVEVEMANYQECMERCLGCLSDEDREIITEYYRYKKSEKIDCRKRLAARLGISLNTLRVKMHRQRMNLESCVEKCLARY